MSFITDEDQRIRDLLLINPKILQLSFDFKNQNWTVWIQGEKSKEIFPTLIEVIERLEE